MRTRDRSLGGGLVPVIRTSQAATAGRCPRRDASAHDLRGVRAHDLRARATRSGSSEIARGTRDARNGGMAEDTPTLRPAAPRAAVLIVDDQGFVRRAIARGLARFGLSIREAADLAEARRALAVDPAITLVLIDVALPDGHGTELLDEVRATRPEVAALLMSGFVTREASAQAIERGAIGCLEKPFTTADLLVYLRGARGSA